MIQPTPKSPRRLSEAASQLLKVPVADPVIAGVVDEPATDAPDPTKVLPDLTKLTVRLERELLGRVRAAYVLDGLTSGHSSLSSWVASVLAERVSAVEAARNGGERLTPIGVDRLPKGRLS